MPLKIYRPPAGRSTDMHRGKRFIGVIDEEDGSTLVRTIDGIRRCVIQLQTGEWVIAPTATAEEDDHSDIGPFDTAEQAVVQLKLLGS